MIVQMEKLVLHALSDDRKTILRRLMQLKCIHLLTPEQMQEFEEIASLSERDVPSTYEYETKRSEISSALSVLAEHECKPGLFAKKEELPLEELLSLDSLDEGLKMASAVRGIVANIAEVKSAQSADLFTRQTLLPWQALDIPLDKAESRTSVVEFFTFPLETDLNRLQDESAALGCALEVVSSDAALHYVAAATLRSARGEVMNLFKEMGALPAALPALSGTVAANLAAIDAREKQNAENAAALSQSLINMAKDDAPMKRAYDQLGAVIAEQRSRQSLLLTEKTFTVAAWVPVPEKEKVDAVLRDFCCFYAYHAPEKNEEPPVKFKNSKLVEPFAVITEMYGLPAPNSVDPNPLLAPFFFLFFGMMLSDAGYGLLLIVLGFGAARMMQKKEGMMYQLLRVIGLCGISTVFWGAVYGSWFGNLVTQIAESWFHKTVLIPMLIDPLKDPMTILILSVAFGFIHLLTGMAVNAYLLIRRGRAWDAVCDVGFWYMVLIGLAGLLVVTMGGGAGVVDKVFMWMAILGAVGLLLTGGREKPSLFGKITGGLGSLYNITSYFSDILSYSRILALGLATGVISMVVNILATMTAPPLGIILFIAIFLFGHALNLAINALGAYVHTSRLQYVEFFGKFYEGGGRPFTPFTAEAKYHIIKRQGGN